MMHRATAPWRVIAAVVWANLQRLSRDRTSLVFIVAVPFLLILIIGMVIPGGDGPSARPVGFVASEGPQAQALVARLEAQDTLELTRYPTEEALRAAVRRGFEVAGVIIPVDLGSHLRAGEQAQVQFVTDPSRTPPLAVRTAVLQAVAQRGALLRSAQFVAERSGISVQAALSASELMPGFASSEVLSQTLGALGQTLPGGFDYTAPAYLVLFMFINTLVAAWGLPVNRALGLTRRAFAAPSRAGAVLLGEWLYRLLVALLQAALIVLLGGALFGVAWGDPWAVTAIVALFALVSTGAAILLGTLCRTAEQVTALAPPIGIALGMLGGCMWPLEIVGPAMQTAGLATPHAWAVAALTEVVGRGARLRDIAQELAVLAGFALALLLIALVVFGRSVRRAGG